MKALNTTITKPKLKRLKNLMKADLYMIMKEQGLSSAWEEVLHNYKIIGKIGEGTFGNVYKAECSRTDKVVAIKHLYDNLNRN